MRNLMRTCVLGGLLASAMQLPSQSAPSVTEAWPWSRLTEALTRQAQAVDGRVGLYLRSLDTGETFSLRGEEVFPAASTIKLALLLELYRQAEGGAGARLDDAYLVRPADLVEGSAILGNLAPGTRLTNHDLALFMVAVSDNSATNVLIERVGMDRVNATLDRLGIRNTRLRRKMMDLQAAREGRENQATPRELADLLVALYRGEALRPEGHAAVLRLLTTPKDGFMTRLLPEDLVVANKPGTLDGVRNDVGIVFVKDRPFVLAVMISHLREDRDGEEAIARLAGEAARWMERAAASSPDGRRFAPLHLR